MPASIVAGADWEQQADRVLSTVAPLDPRTVERAQSFRSYDTDLPPEVNFWVGRSEHLSLLNELPSGVIAITGIGGQGKSALAAKGLQQWRNRHPRQFWDWRDCREEGDRFPTQLASLISRITLSTVDTSSLAASSTAAASRLFFRLVRDSEGLLVFDNVDHYVDAEQGTLSGPLGVFIQEAIRARPKFKIILTCRPRLSYADISFREVPLLGLSEGEAIQLFRSRSIPPAVATESQVRELHRLTRGHPFWLNVLASELQRKNNATHRLIEELIAGSDGSNQIVAMLRPVWNTMSDREKAIMLLLGECPKPLTEQHIGRLLSNRVRTPNQLQRALRAVVAFSLVSKKSNAGQESVYDLHPVVRQYLRTEIGLHDRKPFMKMVAEGTKEYIVTVHRAKGIQTLSIEPFEFSAVNIESHIQSGNLQEAARSAMAVSSGFIVRGLIQEYVRLGSTILNALKWEDLDKPESADLHGLVRDLVARLVEVGREGAARELVAKYSPKLPKDTATRIEWQSTLCRIEWLLGNYDASIRHGRKGVSMKNALSIDTQADAGPNLHLALRDGGHVDEALEYFSRSTSVDTILRIPLESAGRSSSAYGNIGRCLFLQGDVRRALQFYARSWRLMENDESPTTAENKGWAGLWLGEAFLKDGDGTHAAIFLGYARDVWTERLPLKVAMIDEVATRLPVGTVLPDQRAARQTKEACDEVVARLLKQ